MTIRDIGPIVDEISHECGELALYRDGKGRAFMLNDIRAVIECDAYGNWRVKEISDDFFYGRVTPEGAVKTAIIDPRNPLWAVIAAAIERECAEDIDERFAEMGYNDGSYSNNEHRLGSFELLGRR